MIIAQLMASPFFGGPERQVLGLAKAMRPSFETVFLSFGESGAAQDFLNRARDEGFRAIELDNNWPHILRCRRELMHQLGAIHADVLICNGYKPDILGVIAARSMTMPAVSIAHGWTSATAKVRINEWMDKHAMRWFDRVVGVSQEQSRRVIASGVASDRAVTIHNGVDPSQMSSSNESDRRALQSFFPGERDLILVAAGRLSPEKGFDVLVDSMAHVVQHRSDIGLVIFGGGPLESALQQRISQANLQQHVILGGFREDLDRLIPQADGFVLSSRTEGLPVILLEAMAAGVPSVVTPVGGVGELVRDGVEGLHAPVDDARALGNRLQTFCDDDHRRKQFGIAARARIDNGFTHQHQADAFETMLRSLTCSNASV